MQIVVKILIKLILSTKTRVEEEWHKTLRRNARKKLSRGQGDRKGKLFLTKHLSFGHI
jgi:hypothetical protein